MINPKLKQPAPDANPDPFNRPPPGWSLTQPKGKWAWESPPQHTDVDETVDMIIDKLEDPKVSDRYVKLMIAGVSVEEIVDSIALAGFTEGQFNPDVAELVKAPLAIYLMKLADDYDIPFKLFGNPEEMAQEEEGLSEATILRIMRKRNPDMYNYVVNYTPPEAERAVARHSKSQAGFLNVEEKEMPEMEEAGEIEESGEME